MSDTTKHFSLRVPFSTDGTPTVITLPWLGKADVPESPQVKKEGRPSDDQPAHEWAGLLPRTPPNLFRLSESLTPVPETPPPTPVIKSSQLRRSSRVSSAPSFYGNGSIAGTSVSRAKGKSKSKSKSNTTGGRSVTPAQASATTLRGSAGRKSHQSDRYEPYPSRRFTLASHKIKNLKVSTRWFPVSSTHPIRIPPITKDNEDRLEVNDLCINHLTGSEDVQVWIWTVDQEWARISPGDSCSIDGTTRFLRLNAAGVPRWVTRFTQRDTPVAVNPSAPTHASKSSVDLLTSGSSSTLDPDASAASLY